MAERETVLVNLATGLEDAERVTVALLVANAAADAGKRVAIWTTKEAVRLALAGYGVGIACDGCPPVERLLEQFRAAGGELLACPICFSAASLRRAISSTVRAWWARRRSGSGSATARPCSATERAPRLAASA